MDNPPNNTTKEAEHIPKVEPLNINNRNFFKCEGFEFASDNATIFQLADLFLFLLEQEDVKKYIEVIKQQETMKSSSAYG